MIIEAVFHASVSVKLLDEVVNDMRRTDSFNHQPVKQRYINSRAITRGVVSTEFQLLLANAGRWRTKSDFGDGVILWNPHNGQRRRPGYCLLARRKRLVIGTQRFADGSSTADVSLVGTDRAIVNWLPTVPGWAKPVAFSPNGQNIVVLCGGQSIRLFDRQKGELKCEIRPAGSPEKGPWHDFAILPPGERLVFSGTDAENQSFVEIHAVDEKKRVHEIQRDQKIGETERSTSQDHVRPPGRPSQTTTADVSPECKSRLKTSRPSPRRRPGHDEVARPGTTERARRSHQPQRQSGRSVKLTIGSSFLMQMIGVRAMQPVPVRLIGRLRQSRTHSPTSESTTVGQKPRSYSFSRGWNGSVTLICSGAMSSLKHKTETPINQNAR